MPETEYMTDDLPDVGRYLSRLGARRTDEECNECGGILYSFGTDTVCGQCSLVVGSNDPQPSRIELRLPHDRSEHPNSENPRCVGGFIHPYEWTNNSDPLSFYE